MHVTKNTTVNAAPTRISSVSDYSNYRLISNKRRITRLIRATFSFSITAILREEKLQFISFFFFTFQINVKKKNQTNAYKI